MFFFWFGRGWGLSLACITLLRSTLTCTPTRVRSVETSSLPRVSVYVVLVVESGPRISNSSLSFATHSHSFRSVRLLCDPRRLRPIIAPLYKQRSPSYDEHTRTAYFQSAALRKQPSATCPTQKITS